MYRNEGVSGLYRGIRPTLASGVLQSAFMLRWRDHATLMGVWNGRRRALRNYNFDNFQIIHKVVNHIIYKISGHSMGASRMDLNSRRRFGERFSQNIYALDFLSIAIAVGTGTGVRINFSTSLSVSGITANVS